MSIITQLSSISLHSGFVFTKTCLGWFELPVVVGRSAKCRKTVKLPDYCTSYYLLDEG